MADVKMPETPELDKQSEVIKSGKAMQVQNFLDWLLDEQGFVFGKWGVDEFEDPDVLSPTYVDRQQLMAEFFGIDLRKIETERRALLSALQEANEDA